MRAPQKIVEFGHLTTTLIYANDNFAPEKNKCSTNCEKILSFQNK